MKILITGGAGFIGSWLAKSLVEAGHKVVVLDKLIRQVHGDVSGGGSYRHPVPGVEFVRGDVASLEDWHRVLDGVEAVVHLAAETGTGQSMYRIADYNNVNSQGTALLFEALSSGEYPVTKVVLASSRSVYGEGAYTCVCKPSEGRLFTPAPRSAKTLKAQLWEPLCPWCGQQAQATATPEDAKIYPASIYAATKHAQEDLVRISCEALGISSVILRLQNVYGEGQSLNNSYTGILSIFSTRIRHGLSLPIFEDGLESRDFVHISDAVQALELAILSGVPNGRVFNVGSGVATTVMDLARALVAKIGSEVDIEVTGEFRIGDIRHCCADITRIEEELGYRVATSLDEGLGRFVDWALDQPLPDDGLESANEELRQRGLMTHA